MENLVKTQISSSTERMENLMKIQITSATERMENLMKSQVTNADKLEKLMQSHLDLQEDNKSLREEISVICEQPMISQSENVLQPPASGHEEGHSNENISIKENFCLGSNNEIRHSDFDKQSQLNGVSQAVNNQILR